MKGYLSIKNGKYYVVLRHKDENGIWRTKWISTGIDSEGGKEAAEQKLAEVLNGYSIEKEIKTQPVLLKKDEPVEILFSSYVESWLSKEKTAGRISAVTYDMYESMCKNHILPYFVRLKSNLSDIDPDTLQAFINYESTEGNRSLKKGKRKNKGLSPKSVKHLKTILNLVLKEARREKLISDNPCEYISIPKQVKRDVSVFDGYELNELFIRIKDEPLYPLIYITVFYGLRRSEVLGLKWDSVDFRKKTLSIKHTVVKANEIIEKDTTKNDSSFRTFPLSPEAEELFLSLKDKEKENMKKYKNHYELNDYIFKSDSGQMYRPDFITRKFSRLLEKYDMPHIRFHDLRHSCASLLISRGYQLKDVQEWLGHADISTTANIYGHLDQARKKEIMNAMKAISIKDGDNNE